MREKNNNNKKEEMLLPDAVAPFTRLPRIKVRERTFSAAMQKRPIAARHGRNNRYETHHERIPLQFGSEELAVERERGREKWRQLFVHSMTFEI